MKTQSIKSLRKIAANLKRKVEKERRRQEVVIALHQTIDTLSKEYWELRLNGDPQNLYDVAKNIVTEK